MCRSQPIKNTSLDLIQLGTEFHTSIVYRSFRTSSLNQSSRSRPKLYFFYNTKNYIDSIVPRVYYVSEKSAELLYATFHICRLVQNTLTFYLTKQDKQEVIFSSMYLEYFYIYVCTTIVTSSNCIAVIERARQSVNKQIDGFIKSHHKSSFFTI